MDKNLEIFIYSDQPTTCPICGARTEITLELLKSPEQTQYHKCLSIDCNFEFIMQNDI